MQVRPQHGRAHSCTPAEAAAVVAEEASVQLIVGMVEAATAQ